MSCKDEIFMRRISRFLGYTMIMQVCKWLACKYPTILPFFIYYLNPRQGRVGGYFFGKVCADMKLDPDIVRALLLALEDKLRLNNELEYHRVFITDVCSSIYLSGYCLPSITYTALKLKEAGYIDAYIESSDGRISAVCFSSITFTGHQFLENIRNQANWHKTKEVAVKAGNFTLKVLESISSGLATAYIKNTCSGATQT